jgi:hypothetical protein
MFALPRSTKVSSTWHVLDCIGKLNLSKKFQMGTEDVYMHVYNCIMEKIFLFLNINVLILLIFSWAFPARTHKTHTSTLVAVKNKISLCKGKVPETAGFWSAQANIRMQSACLNREIRINISCVWVEGCGRNNQSILSELISSIWLPKVWLKMDERKTSINQI